MPLNEFKPLFKKEYEQYCLLFEKAQAKQEAIIGNNIDMLAEIIAQEQGIIEKIDELEEKRHIFLHEHVSDKETDKDEISFDKLLEYMPEERKEMIELKQDFLGVLEKIQNINEENKKLIEDSLKITDNSLQVIRQALSKGNVYTKKDNSNDQTKHIIDEKI